MTEDEAKTKACCKGANTPSHSGNCIGSACMAWRKFSLDEQTRGDPSKKGGYCGLAGKP